MLETAPIIAFLATSDPARAKAFYRDTLGLRLVADDVFALVFDVGASTLRIQKVDVLKPQPHTVLGWRVADIDAAVTDLLVRGVEFERYPWMEQDARGVWTAPDGVRVAWFLDTDGNVLSITEQPDG